jgi:hypothetical protein
MGASAPTEVSRNWDAACRRRFGALKNVFFLVFLCDPN